jgi:hypothetical protein
MCNRGGDMARRVRWLHYTATVDALERERSGQDRRLHRHTPSVPKCKHLLTFVGRV